MAKGTRLIAAHLEEVDEGADPIVTHANVLPAPRGWRAVFKHLETGALHAKPVLGWGWTFEPNEEGFDQFYGWPLIAFDDGCLAMIDGTRANTFLEDAKLRFECILGPGQQYETDAAVPLLDAALSDFELAQLLDRHPEPVLLVAEEMMMKAARAAGATHFTAHVEMPDGHRLPPVEAYKRFKRAAEDARDVGPIERAKAAGHPFNARGEPIKTPGTP